MKAKDVQITEIPKGEEIEFECVTSAGTFGQYDDYTVVFTNKGMWLKRHKGLYLIDLGSRDAEFIPYSSFTKAEKFKLWRTSGYKFRFNKSGTFEFHFCENTDKVAEVLAKYIYANGDYRVHGGAVPMQEKKITSIHYFNYTKKIGYYASFREYYADEITFLGYALSTPEVRVNAAPVEYKIKQEGTAQIKAFLEKRLPQLKEVGKVVAVSSPEYILVSYNNGSDHYFEHDAFICEAFEMAKRYRPQERDESPYRRQPCSETRLNDMLLVREEAPTPVWTHVETKTAPSSTPVPAKEVSPHSAFFCRRCGEKLFSDSVFCHKCGTKVLTSPELEVE